MFTGIIEEIGEVVKVQRKPNLLILSIKARKTSRGMKGGDSLAVDGVCLTVVKAQKDVLVFELMRETLSKSTLDQFKVAQKVNLERSLKIGGLMHGHFVTGHIDGLGMIEKRIAALNFTKLQIKPPASLSKYIVPKGSISLDGVSLTIGEVQPKYFSVYLIPFTEKQTTLGLKRAGDQVNIEIDILARYVQGKATRDE